MLRVWPKETSFQGSRRGRLAAGRGLGGEGQGGGATRKLRGPTAGGEQGLGVGYGKSRGFEGLVREDRRR